MDDRTAQTASRLPHFLNQWLQANPGWAYQYNADHWAMEFRSAVDVAQDLLNAADADQLRFASFLRSPDGELVRAIVGRLLPWPESAEFRLLVDAILLAANGKTRDERVLVGVLTGLVGLALFLGSFGD
jgi:hypothetical protein